MATSPNRLHCQGYKPRPRSTALPAPQPGNHAGRIRAAVVGLTAAALVGLALSVGGAEPTAPQPIPDDIEANEGRDRAARDEGGFPIGAEPASSQRSERPARRSSIQSNPSAKQPAHSKAVAEYTAKIQSDPLNPALRIERARRWLEAKEYDKAIADCSNAIALDPKSARAYLLRGIVWNEKRRYDKAVPDLREALRLSPQSTQARDLLEKLAPSAQTRSKGTAPSPYPRKGPPVWDAGPASRHAVPRYGSGQQAVGSAQEQAERAMRKYQAQTAGKLGAIGLQWMPTPGGTSVGPLPYSVPRYVRPGGSMPSASPPGRSAWGR